MNTLNGFDAHDESVSKNLEKFTEMNNAITALKTSLDATNKRIDDIADSLNDVEQRLSDLRWIPGYHK